MTTVMVTVDTEEEWDWSEGWPRENYSVDNIAHLPRFQELCERYAMRPTYFVNYAVVVDPEARGIIASLRQRDGVEIGMHIHPWNTPPEEHTRPYTEQESFLHNLPAEIVQQKLKTVYQAFLEQGWEPKSFRGGRYSTSPAIQRFLVEHDFVADCSVVPFTKWDNPGSPDFTQRGVLPQRAVLGGKEQSLWELPLTVGFTRTPWVFWAQVFNTIEFSWLSQLRLIGILQRLKIVERGWLNFENQTTIELQRLLQAFRRFQLPSLCLCLHSSALMAGKWPGLETKAQEEEMFEKLECVFGELQSWQEVQPATASEVAAIWEGKTDASARIESAG